MNLKNNSGDRLCETLSKTSRTLLEENDEFYKRLKMQEIEAERKRDALLVQELDNWLPLSIKSKLDEEEEKEKQRETILEQRRKKVLATTSQQKQKQSSSRPVSSKKKK